ncbi:hypothetical protein [Caldimonas brevitalea]|uniref:Protein ImuA n=1 Tax=Caldimonas brevitalea TaxID=413882 RepID=A0A0G3BIH6_9BURK|nr:hypothetical protein [Caldimonas brevitalea]AKJ29254.1 hypothetical protein AAW51_2563 [Caldimonas brevitalea]
MTPAHPHSPASPATPSTAPKPELHRPAQPSSPAAFDAAPRTGATSWWTRLVEQLGLPVGPSLRDWRAANQASAATPTGFPSLDAVLPAGGWPAAGVIEVLAPQPGRPELALLNPVLSEAAAQGRRHALIGQPPDAAFDTSEGGSKAPAVHGADSACATGPASPLVPSAAADTAVTAAMPLVARHTPATGGSDAAASSSETGRPDTLALALAWLRQGKDGVLAVWLPEFRPAQLRDLQRVARRARSMVFVVRPWVAHWDDSEADLRVSLIAGKGGRWEVRVHLQAGGAAPTVRVPALGPAPVRHLRVVQDPSDHRRTMLSGSFVEVCRELERLAALERAAEPNRPPCRLVVAH